MMQHAHQLAENGRAVYVVALNQLHVESLRRVVKPGSGIKIESFEEIEQELDIYNCRLRYGHPNCVVLLDHAVIERYFLQLLNQLHAFDSEPVVHGNT